MTNAVCPIPTAIYHITHGKNLPSIITMGGLYCCRKLQQAATSYANIAYHHIQDRRATAVVPCRAGGVLHQYVPFYFAPRSPMLYTISMGNVPGYAEGVRTSRERQRPLIDLVSSAQSVHDATLSFAFTNGHAVMELTDFYDDLAHIGEIDWPLMKATIWRNTASDNDRTRRRQAEFLVHEFFPWHLVSEIGVYDQQIKARVESLLAHDSHRPVVNVYRMWYY